MRFLILLVGFFSTGVFAAPPNPPIAYKCHIILFTKDLPKGYAEQNFEAGAQVTRTHGGQEYPFTFGKYNLTVLANSRWMGITWNSGSEMVAQSIYARGDDATGSQVIMAFNPHDPDEYASLDCDPKY